MEEQQRGNEAEKNILLYENVELLLHPELLGPEYVTLIQEKKELEEKIKAKSVHIVELKDNISYHSMESLKPELEMAEKEVRDVQQQMAILTQSINQIIEAHKTNPGGAQKNEEIENIIEKSPERILSKQEVLDFLGSFVENPAVARELFDEKGLYLLEVQVEGKEPGEIIEYEYVRKGRVLNNSHALETALHVNYYQDGMPISGDKVAVLNEETGEWEKRAK